MSISSIIVVLVVVVVVEVAFVLVVPVVDVVCDEMRLSVEFVTVGFLGICRQYCCD